MRRSIVITMVAMALGLAFLAGPVRSEKDPTAPSPAENRKALALFNEVYDRVQRDYVQPVTPAKAIDGALNGMLSALDPHSAYMNAQAYRDMQADTSGEFGGLGLEVQPDNGNLRVVAPIDDTPAAKAGIRPSDLIAAIDDKPLGDFGPQEAVDALRGAPGTQVKILIHRGAEAPFELTLTRAIIRTKSVKTALLRGNVAYLRISSFAAHTDRDLEAGFADLKQQAKGKLIGLVLDLRSDPGGLLDQAVAVGGAFLGEGEIVSTRGRRPDDRESYSAHRTDMTGGLPIVVLIDGGTASAAEIVAGALQDRHRAMLLGTRSFGKGSVQSIIPLGDDGAIRLTTALYFTPSGRSIQDKGIDPDVMVEPATIQPIKAGTRQREADLKGALKNPDDPAAGAAGAGEAKVAPVTDPAAVGTDKDYQLNRALDLLAGVAGFAKKGP
jgi:carboxyl-terminal processing protease